MNRASENDIRRNRIMPSKSTFERMKGRFGEMGRKMTPKKLRKYMEKRKRDNYLPDTSDPYSGRTREVYGGGKRKRRRTQRKPRKTRRTKRRTRKSRR